MSEEQKYGVENLWPLVAFGLEFGNVADKFGRKKGLPRYMTLTELSDEVWALGKVDFALAKKELGELSAAELGDLKGRAKDKFDITDDMLESAIEEGLDIAHRGYELVADSIALVKKLKSSKA